MKLNCFANENGNYWLKFMMHKLALYEILYGFLRDDLLFAELGCQNHSDFLHWNYNWYAKRVKCMSFTKNEHLKQKSSKRQITYQKVTEPNLSVNI